MLQHHKPCFFIKNTVKLQLHGIFVPDGIYLLISLYLYYISHYIDIASFQLTIAHTPWLKLFDEGKPFFRLLGSQLSDLFYLCYNYIIILHNLYIIILHKQKGNNMKIISIINQFDSLIILGIYISSFKLITSLLKPSASPKNCCLHQICSLAPKYALENCTHPFFLLAFSR